jgi:hypothetical protein
VIFALAAFYGEDTFTQWWQRRQARGGQPKLVTTSRSSS